MEAPSSGIEAVPQSAGAVSCCLKLFAGRQRFRLGGAGVCGVPDNAASLLPQSTGVDSVQVWELNPDNSPHDAGPFARRPCSWHYHTVAQLVRMLSVVLL